MRHAKRATRAFVLILSVGLMVSACKGTQTKVANEKTAKLVAQMENLNASQHAPAKLEEIKNLVARSNQELANKQTAQAYDLAKQAKQAADQAIIEVKGAEARAMWDIAEREIQVADTNGINRLNPDAYQQIRTTRDVAQQARDANDYDEVIKLCRQIRDDVGTLLNPLKTDSERAKIGSEGKLQELKSAGGLEYAPEIVIAVQDMIQRADKTATETRDYVLAKSIFTEASTEADRGIETVQREKGKELIDFIEDQLGVALEEGAREFVPDEYEKVVGLLEGIIQDYSEERYQRVNITGRELKPRAELLVENTKRLASDSRIRTMRRDIQALVEGGAREYLPGRVEVVEAQLARALDVRKADDVPAFDQIKSISQDAADETDKINRAFEDLATEQIRLAANQIDTSDSVFVEVASIFRPIPDPPEDMKPFEEGKEARRQQLGKELAQARNALVVADSRMKEQKYRDAILLSQEQGRVANNILGEIYRLVANNAIVELSNLISRYERDGARLYAPDELDRSNVDLARVKSAVNDGQFLLASELAAAARANVELMAQRIAGRAVENIRDARRDYDEVNSEKTRQYSAELLAQVSQLIDQAGLALQEQQLKLAVESANAASETARAALNQANQKAAEAAVSKAVANIDRAQKAGASLYAGREMESARKLLDSSEALLKSEDFVKAEELGLSSAEKAEQAFYKKVNEAEAAIADAKSVGGWEHDNTSLSRASAKARTARERLAAGDYGESGSLADDARAIASSVSDSAKAANYRDFVARLKSNLEQGRQQGINYFQVEESVAARQRLAEIESEWSLERYDYVIAELKKLEGSLRQTLDSTGTIVTLVADQQTARLNRLVEAGASDYAAGLIGDAETNLKLARIDYRNGQYKSAHSSLDKAIKMIDEVQHRHDQEAYVDSVEALFARYAAAQDGFSNVLTLGPNELKSLAFGSFSRGNSIAISGRITATDFRKAIDRLYSEALLVNVPEGMAKVHESVIEGLNRGRSAAIHFEKLVILNESSNAEAARLIDAAYEEMNASNKIVNDLKRQFFTDEVRFRLVASTGPGVN